MRPATKEFQYWEKFRLNQEVGIYRYCLAKTWRQLFYLKTFTTISVMIPIIIIVITIVNRLEKVKYFVSIRTSCEEVIGTVRRNQKKKKNVTRIGTKVQCIMKIFSRTRWNGSEKSGKAIRIWKTKNVLFCGFKNIIYKPLEW